MTSSRTRFSRPVRGNLRRRLDKSGASRPGFFLFNNLKEYQDGEEESEEGRQEKEEAESIITKEKEVVKDSWKEEGGRQEEIRQEEEEGGKKEESKQSRQHGQPCGDEGEHSGSTGAIHR